MQVIVFQFQKSTNLCYHVLLNRSVYHTGLKSLSNETLKTNFPTSLPTTRQFDREYDSFIVMCVCAPVRQNQTRTERN